MGIVFGEPGKWGPSVDLLAHTKDGVETFVRLGETIGVNLQLDTPISSGSVRLGGP
jgi:hypothetical protein